MNVRNWNNKKGRPEKIRQRRSRNKSLCTAGRLFLEVDVMEEKDKYCSECGAKLDWSDDE